MVHSPIVGYGLGVGDPELDHTKLKRDFVFDLIY